MKEEGINPFAAGFLAFAFLLIVSVVIDATMAKYNPQGFFEKTSLAKSLLPHSKGIVEYSERLYLDASSSSGIKVAFKAFVARKLFLLGVLFAMFVKLWFFALLGLLALAVYWLYQKREYFADLYLMWKVQRLVPFRDRSVEYLLAILMKNPVPASILHHDAHEGGLFRHSLKVAYRSAKLCKEKGLSPKKCFLAGLLHDVGKLLIYKKVKKQSIPAPSPVGAKPVAREGDIYVSSGINQRVANRIALRLLKEKYHIEVPEDEGIWQVVREADRQTTSEELRKGLYRVSGYFQRVLKELETEGYQGMWRKGDYLFVLAERFNEKLVEVMLEEDPSLPLSTRPDMKGVHVIAYSVVVDMPIVKEYEGKKADTLGLFDLEVGGKRYRAVYIFRMPSFLSLEETLQEVAIVER